METSPRTAATKPVLDKPAPTAAAVSGITLRRPIKSLPPLSLPAHPPPARARAATETPIDVDRAILPDEKRPAARHKGRKQCWRWDGVAFPPPERTPIQHGQGRCLMQALQSRTTPRACTCLGRPSGNLGAVARAPTPYGDQEASATPPTTWAPLRVEDRARPPPASWSEEMLCISGPELRWDSDSCPVAGETMITSPTSEDFTVPPSTETPEEEVVVTPWPQNTADCQCLRLQTPVWCQRQPQLGSGVTRTTTTPECAKRGRRAPR